jgi:hypothetical protein
LGLQLLEWTVTPFGPVVVARTRPLPATTDVPTLPLPLLDLEMVQPFELLPVTTVVLVPPELPTLTELLTCACAIEALRPTKTEAANRVRKAGSLTI